MDVRVFSLINVEPKLMFRARLPELVVHESGLGLESGFKSIFAGFALGLGIEQKGLRLGVETVGLGLGLDRLSLSDTIPACDRQQDSNQQDIFRRQRPL